MCMNDLNIVGCDSELVKAIAYSYSLLRSIPILYIISCSAFHWAPFKNFPYPLHTVSFPQPELYVQSIISSLSRRIVADEVRELQEVKIVCKILWYDNVKTFIGTLL
jgi:hypothetical protein